MKNISVILTMLVASVFLSAITAFSSSGPFGGFGPNDYTEGGRGDITYSNMTVSGTGPYGAFGYMHTDTERGGVSSVAATPGGSGPYGAFDIYGMIPDKWSTAGGNRAECIMVAKNCLTDK